MAKLNYITKLNCVVYFVQNIVIMTENYTNIGNNQSESSCFHLFNSNKPSTSTATYSHEYHTVQSPIKLGPEQKKQRLSVDFSKCTICQDVSAAEKLGETRTPGKLNIIAAARKRKDEVFKLLNAEFNNLDILEKDEKLTLQYHRKCFQTYTSKTNLNYIQHKTDVEDNDSSDCDTILPTTRSKETTD